MKTKRIVFIIFIATSLTVANAQNFKLSDQVLDVGIGFGSSIYSSGSYSMGIPPLSISYEKGIKDDIIEKGVFSIGGYLGVSSYKYSITGSSASDIIIGARGALHYPLIQDPKLDTYLGLMVFYNIESWSAKNSENESNGGPGWSIYLGGRYYFDKKISGFVELGYGISYLTVGVGFKL